MKAFIFPGQGSQFSGMGYDLYKNNSKAKKLFELSNKIVEFDITKIMFEGSTEDLKQTNVTQPAIFIHSVISAKCISSFKPDMVAGHSLGEISAITAAKTLSFEDGLKLVIARSQGMHEACINSKSTMAAIIGLDAKIVRKTCMDQEGIVVPANYNSHNQIVISGEKSSVEKTCEILKSIGAKRAIILAVAGAFHSPIMESAKTKLAQAISDIEFQSPICSIYQNVVANRVKNKSEIKSNLIDQLTQPVQWYQTIEQMIKDGASSFFEIGPGNVLTNLNKRINNIVITKKL